MSIVNNCMLVTLRLGSWSGRRLDKGISGEVTAQKEAQEGSLTVNKQLVPKDVLAASVTAANNVRAHFYEKTLPWAEQGARVITRTGYQKFIEDHQALVGLFHSAVEDLIAVGYPQARAQAEFRMGLAFNLADYPEAYELRDKFYVDLDIAPVPTGADFRVDISSQAAEAIRQQIETKTRDRLAEAAKSVWERLRDVVGHYAKTMGDQDIKFKEATIRNLHDLMDAMPALNITEDPALDQFAKEVRQSLSWSSAEIRKDPSTRAAAAAEAERILDQMSGFMNAFGGQQQEAA